MASLSERFEELKAVIERLYVVDNKSLSDVMAVMADKEYNFEASKYQFERRLKLWGFRKNASDAKLYWPTVLQILEQRRRRSKGSIVSLHGKRLSKKQIQKAKSLYRNVSHIPELEDSMQSSGWIVRSPSPQPVDDLADTGSEVRMEDADNFHIVESAEERDTSPDNKMNRSQSSPVISLHMEDMLAIAETEFDFQYSIFDNSSRGYISPNERSPSPPRYDSYAIGAIWTQYASPLDQIYPSYSLISILEEAKVNFLRDVFYRPNIPFSGDSKFRSENIMVPSRVKTSQQMLQKWCLGLQDHDLPLDRLIDILKTVMIRLGNNIDDKNAQEEYVDNIVTSGAFRHHIAIIGKFLEIEHTMVGNLAIHLLYGAARTGVKDLIVLILGIYDGDTDSSSRWRSNRHRVIATANQFAMERQQGHVCSFLIRNFDVNTPPFSEISSSLLLTAVMVGDENMVRELLERGAQDKICENGCARGLNFSRDYIERLIDLGYPWARSLLKISTNLLNPTAKNSLHLALMLPNTSIISMLLQHTEEAIQKMQFSEVDTSILHLYAIVGDHPQTLRQLLKSETLDIDINIEVQIYERTALCLAAEMRRRECVNILLDCGADAFQLITVVRRYFNRWGDIKDFFESVGPRLTNTISELYAQVKAKIEREKAEVAERQIGAYKPLFNQQHSWYERFQSYEANKSQIFDCIDVISADHDNLRHEIRLWFTLISPRIRSAGISVELDTYEKIISVYINAGPWNHTDIGKIKSILPFLEQVFSIYVGASYTDLLEVSTDMTLPMSELRPLFNRLERPIFPAKNSEADQTWAEWEKACMVSDLDDPLWGSQDPSRRLNLARGLSKLRDLNSQVKNGNLTGLQYVLQWAISVSDTLFVRNLMVIWIPHINELCLKQAQALLRHAVNLNQHKVVDAIITSHGAAAVTEMILQEAIWSSDIQTFDTILATYFAKPDASMELIEQMLYVPIALANLYKAEKLLNLDGFNVNHILANKFTFIEAAASTGRLDIVQALINKGAVANLDLASKAACKSGHINICHLIEDAYHKIISSTRDSTPSVSRKFMDWNPN